MDRATLENLAAKHGTPPPPLPVELERLNWILACHLCTALGVPFPPMPPHIREEGEPAAIRKADSTAPKIPGKAYAVQTEGGPYRLVVCSFDPATGEPVEFSCSLLTEFQRTAAALSEAIVGVIATDAGIKS